MTVAAEAADLDMLAYVKGSACGFIQHRGITHTFLGSRRGRAGRLAWSGWWTRSGNTGGGSVKLPEAPARRWGWLYLCACVAGLSHILLDFTNNYGVRPFYPFSGQWYAWDIVFIIEPLMLAVLIAALVLPGLFRLVGEEIGAREHGPAGRGAAIAALLFIVALWGVRDLEHRRALAALDALEYQGEAAVRVAAFPYMVNPFQWAGVAETSKAYISMRVDSLVPQVDPGNRAQRYYKPEPTEATEAARKTALGSFYMEWARFPLVEAERRSTAGSTPEAADLVHFSDVRYFYPGASRRPLQAYVLLDSHHHAVSDKGSAVPKGGR